MSTVLMFASSRPFKEVPFPEDFEIHIDTKRRAVDDGGEDNLFGISPSNGYLEIKTDMKYFAELTWFTYTPGRANRIIEYLREHLKTTDEIELWHVWLDNSFDNAVRKRYIPIDELTADMLREIDQISVWEPQRTGQRPHCRKQTGRQIDLSELEELATDYCYVITRPKGSTL